jgi:hypothetical protein
MKSQVLWSISNSCRRKSKNAGGIFSTAVIDIFTRNGTISGNRGALSRRPADKNAKIGDMIYKFKIFPGEDGGA